MERGRCRRGRKEGEEERQSELVTVPGHALGHERGGITWPMRFLPADFFDFLLTPLTRVLSYFAHLSCPTLLSSSPGCPSSLSLSSSTTTFISSPPSFALVPCTSKLCRLSWPGAHAAHRGRFTGTRIVYDKSALLHLKHSPLARTPPRTMPHIPGVTHAAPGAEVVTAAAVPSDHHHHHEHGVPAAKPAAATAPAPAASGGTHGLRRRLSPTRTS